jgi:hypothetical protein
MKGWTLKLAVALILVPAARAGKLDLDIYASGPNVPRARADAPARAPYDWAPGDPRDLKDGPKWVKHLSHVGYAGLGIAGVAGSIASGGVAPAIGFGLVALVQSYLEWREIKTPSE